MVDCLHNTHSCSLLNKPFCWRNSNYYSSLSIKKGHGMKFWPIRREQSAGGFWGRLLPPPGRGSLSCAGRCPSWSGGAEPPPPRCPWGSQRTNATCCLWTSCKGEMAEVFTVGPISQGFLCFAANYIVADRLRISCYWNLMESHYLDSSSCPHLQLSRS